jgi:hypothetical protein
VDERDRRHSRQFEPPPWEQDAFERFEKKRRELQQEAELDAALAAVRDDRVVPVVESQEEVAQEAEPKGPPESDQAEEAVPRDKQVGSKGPSSAELATMLIGLKHQEPAVTKSYKVVANTVSGLLVVSGIGFVIWATVLFSKVGSDQGMMPTLASLLLITWGFLLMGGAVLLFRKYNL